ncbi:MAG: type II secretion system F family protein [bacterium]|nr:type II secretion system F family protein [bacterium]
MNKFRYQAKNSQGVTITGLVEAIDESRAIGAIRERGLTTFSLIAIKPSIFSQISAKFFHRISQGELTTFTRQLSTMTTTGLTINDTLALLKEESSPAFSEIIDDILRNVEGGLSLTDAMAKHPEVFSQVYVSLVRAGEAAGVLDTILSRLADNQEKQKEFMDKIRGAMIYPIIIIIGMIVVASIMMVFVIPKLLAMYTDFKAELPLPTKILINVSNFAVSYWWVCLIALLIGGYFFNNFRKTPFGKRKVDKLTLHMPLIGKMRRMVIMAEMTRTLGLLMSAGISVIEALNITASAVGSIIFEEKLRNAAKHVEKGLSFAALLRDDEEFPAVVPQMISVGEETGKMDEVLTKLSHYFGSESEQMVKGLTTAIEPLIMVLLGIGVGFLIIAVILPIYNLTSQF